MTPRASRPLALLAALLVAGGLAGPAAAGPPDDLPGVAYGRGASSPAEVKAVAEYWTPERMRAARSADVLAPVVTPSQASSADVAAGSGSVAPKAPQAKPVKPGTPGGTTGAVTGAPWTGGTAVVTTTGKVFFTLGGANYVCSGSAVTSGNESVVLTAGHCLNEGPGAFATNFAFVPAYADGARPYGTFVATGLWTTEQWRTSGDFVYDVGFAKVAPVNGVSLTDTVGSQGIGFSASRTDFRYSFGYPAARPYDGSDLIYCAGTITGDPYGSDTLGLGCTMTGGSSGGPWLSGFSTSTGLGTLTSVNSYKYTADSTRMYGPYLGSVAQQAYATASRA